MASTKKESLKKYYRRVKILIMFLSLSLVMFLHQLAKCAVFYTWACFPSILMHFLDLLNNRDVFRICALHKERAGVGTETAMAAVQGKEIKPLDRASPLPSHILNRPLVFGQYPILDLKRCVMCPVLGVFLPWKNKMLSCTYYSLNVFLQDSPLILGPQSFWVGFFPGLTEL